MHNKIKRLLKLISIIAFICIILTNLISLNNPAKGYELSIYESTPFIVWLLIIICFFIAIFIIFHQVFTGEYKTSKFWMIGFLIFILTRVTLLSVPFTRGYITWKADHISHIGAVKDILLYGNIGEGNFYPAEHIFMSTTKIITNAPLMIIMNQSSIIFSILFLIYIYLLSKIILPKEGQLLCLAAIGGVLFNDFHVFLRPIALAVFMFPLPLYLFYKKSMEYRILLIIFLLFYPFLHPNAAVVLVISFLSIGLFRKALYKKALFRKAFFKVFKKKKLKSQPYLSNKVPHFIIPTLIVTITLIAWLTYVPGYETAGFWATFYKRLMALDFTQIEMATRDLDKIDLDLFSLIWLGIKEQGDELLFIFSGIIALFFLRKSFPGHRLYQKEMYLIDLLLLLCVFIFLFFAFLFFNPFAIWGTARSLRYLELITPIFMGFILYKSLNLKRYSLLICTIIICFIFIASMISVIGLFSSPHVMRPSLGVTDMDMEGMEWYIEYKDQEIGNVIITQRPDRYAHAIRGKVVIDQRPDIDIYNFIPDHFNYTSYETLGESYNEDKYTVITKVDRVAYDTVWKKVGRFNKTDFQKLEIDPTVSKIYSNGELDIRYIVIPQV